MYVWGGIMSRVLELHKLADVKEKETRKRKKRLKVPSFLPILMNKLALLA